MRLPLLFVCALAIAAGCNQETASTEIAAAEADYTGDATIKFTGDFETKLTGRAKAGKGLRVEYALERLPQCRGNVGGGGPGWNVTGYYSENGGDAKTFEVSEVSSDGKDRVTKASRIELKQGGDLALWFQVTSRWGCSEYDSANGKNYHVDVEGAAPDSEASIVFHKSGDPEQKGALKAGGKVKIRYEQDRLPQCRRTQAGNPQWNITGFAKLTGEDKQTFETSRPDGSDRDEIDAFVDLPRAGELSLWFQVTSLGGCAEYDSNGGSNYRFQVEP